MKKRGRFDSGNSFEPSVQIKNMGLQIKGQLSFFLECDCCGRDENYKDMPIGAEDFRDIENEFSSCIVFHDFIHKTEGLQIANGFDTWLCEDCDNSLKHERKQKKLDKSFQKIK